MLSKSFATFTGIAAGTAASLMMLGTAAEAATLSAGDIVNAGDCVSFTTCTVNGFTVTASGAAADIDPTTAVMTQKTVGGVLGIGVENTGTKDDPSRGEIDIGEYLTFNFAAGIIRELDLSFLYQPGEYGDQVFESAKVTAGGLTGLLTVTGDNTAVWSLGGTVTNLSPSVEGSGGSYSIFNPFGDLEVSEMILTAQSNGSATSFRNSDYSFSRVVVDTAVPEPGTVAALLGIAGVGLTLRRRNLSDQQDS